MTSGEIIGGVIVALPFVALGIALTRALHRERVRDESAFQPDEAE